MPVTNFPGGLSSAGIAIPKIVAGEVALDGTNPTAVATGLTTITSVSLTLKTASAPGVSTECVTYDVSGGTLNIYGWKATSLSNPTLIASTGTDTVGYLVTGS
jgi:hypothetical protein